MCYLILKGQAMGLADPSDINADLYNQAAQKLASGQPLSDMEKQALGQTPLNGVSNILQAGTTNPSNLQGAKATNVFDPGTNGAKGSKGQGISTAGGDTSEGPAAVKAAQNSKQNTNNAQGSTYTPNLSGVAGVPTGAPPGASYTGMGGLSGQALQDAIAAQRATQTRNGNEAAAQYFAPSFSGMAPNSSPQVGGAPVTPTPPPLPVVTSYPAGPRIAQDASANDIPKIPPGTSPESVASIIGKVLDVLGVGMSGAAGVQRESLGAKDLATQRAITQNNAQNQAETAKQLAIIQAQTEQEKQLIPLQFQQQYQLAIEQGDIDMANKIRTAQGMQPLTLEQIKAQSAANMAEKKAEMDYELSLRQKSALTAPWQSYLNMGQ